MKGVALFAYFLCCLIHDSRPQNLPGLSTEEWNGFKSRYSKTYKSATEETLRMQTYISNKKLIALHNEKFSKGEVSFELGMNQFGDLLYSEFVQKVNNNLGVKNLTLENGKENKIERPNKGNWTLISSLSESTSKGTPNSVDWREKGIVAGVKDEGNCHASWAFSANGALESGYARLEGKLIPLSEQNLIDCVRHNSQGEEVGCNNGDVLDAFQYALNPNGDENDINTEKSYPYEGVQGQCRQKPENNAGYSLVGFRHGIFYLEDILASYLADAAPLSFHIDASQQSFQFYKRGVYYEEKCNLDKPTRWVLAVGYGVDNGTEYWLLKNSWGTSWGEDGYIRIARNKNQNCGVGRKYALPHVFGIHDKLKL